MPLAATVGGSLSCASPGKFYQEFYCGGSIDSSSTKFAPSRSVASDVREAQLI